MIKAIKLSILGLFALVGCSKTVDSYNTIEKQTQRIETYVERSLYEFENVDGVYRTRTNVNSVGSSDLQIERGDSVYFNFAGYLFTSQPTTAFYTNILSVAIANNFSEDAFDMNPLGAVAGEGKMVEILERGIIGAHLNDSLMLISTSDLAYKEKQFGAVPKYSPVSFNVMVLKVIKND